MVDQRESVDSSPKRKLICWTVLLTVVFEVITCVMRFGLKLESTRDTASTIGRWTWGLRIHHGYLGLLMIAVSSWIWSRYPRLAFWLLVVGGGLLFSDLVHHFLVLWPVTGSPQFDLVYP